MAQTDVTITMTRSPDDKWWLVNYASASNGTSSFAASDGGMIRMFEEIQNFFNIGQNPTGAIQKRLANSAGGRAPPKVFGTPIVFGHN